MDIVQPHYVSHDRATKGVAERLVRPLGLRLVGDLHERAGDLGVRLPAGAKRRRRLAAIRQRGILFIHVPKNAGTSVSVALYGRELRHESIRSYLHAAPDLVRTMPSFAILRDPVERFISAFGFARCGGGQHRQVAAPFRAQYMKFKSLDDALTHVEQARSPYQMDHFFRPQSWYVTDRDGRVAVDHLIPLHDLGQAGRLIPGLGDVHFPFLNEGPRRRQTPTCEQEQRIRDLYRCDYDLMAGTLARRT
ncbi:sulfotransferase family 2 domain-containing protein [Gluconacetobacter tumulisoli]|uniref:Sulfotransferase family 2 domain-containing protein n=1 Tax=Gluconacetobacter tumulisoli TaxID=1286189 RepID=A0A7W4K6G6_9PROT|nr:sulfotransferase family 2 domain-containing protein [Gluconacetobacter tumulisoli]MBB2201268.1 sulfotransferase family 2 domain-containing protein [Gluconacetobacter tumulisoli]